MPHSCEPSSLGVESLVILAQRELEYFSASVDQSETITIDGTVFPLDAFSLNHRNDLLYFPPGDTQLEVSPLGLAAYKGLDKLIYTMVGASKDSDHLQDHLDDALFLAHFANHEEIANLLRYFGANPGRRFRSNGLHGAVRQRHMSHIRQYVQDFGVPVDTEDENSMTPVMYAMQLKYPYDLETISNLFFLGADPRHEFGDEGWSYEQYAMAMGKKDLAKWLRVRRHEAEAKAKLNARMTPTSSRESSCTIGRG